MSVDLFTPREDLAIDLWRYGEDDLWKRAYIASTRKMRKISDRALDHLLEGEQTASGDSMLIAKALALAAVEVFEGQPRALKRKARRPEKDVPRGPAIRRWIANSLDILDMAFRGR